MKLVIMVAVMEIGSNYALSIEVELGQVMNKIKGMD
jgi:hypothetical protein